MLIKKGSRAKSLRTRHIPGEIAGRCQRETEISEVFIARGCSSARTEERAKKRRDPMRGPLGSLVCANSARNGFKKRFPYRLFAEPAHRTYCMRYASRRGLGEKCRYPC